MQKGKITQLLLNRRAWLSGFFASASLYFGMLLLPERGLAQNGAPSPPTIGGARENKTISENEFNQQFDVLQKRWDANARSYKKQLNPAQVKQQRQEAKKNLRKIIESNGYKIVAPMNLRIIVD